MVTGGCSGAPTVCPVELNGGGCTLVSIVAVVLGGGGGGGA